MTQDLANWSVFITRVIIVDGSALNRLLYVRYAETFPIVGGDFSFYQFPSDAFWSKLFASALAALRFGF